METVKMIAFHGNKSIKKKYLDRVIAHRKADEIVKGKYWENGKGCAVGCTIHSGQHSAYETELGIPQWLAKVEDKLFEGMTGAKAKIWPELFLKAIKPGVDLEKVKGPFLCFVLRSTLDKFDHKKYPNVLTAINRVLDLYESGETDRQKFRDAAHAATYAATYAASAAYAAAYAAYTASAAYAAAYAAYTASAAYAADAAASAANAASAAGKHSRSKAYGIFADQLLKLLKGCK